jgi:protein-S-isoprenylcysteine O-methyltransferase Ste14
MKITRPRLRLYPPVWFLANLAGAWTIKTWLPLAAPMPPFHRMMGACAITFGLGLSVLAILTVLRSRTPVLPYQQPKRLLDGGVFRWTRNPIYLGEAFTLGGFALHSGQWGPWLFLPLFIVGLNRGAIAWEESALRQEFGDAFTQYCRRTRRWL